jgi:hypothetical protein
MVDDILAAVRSLEFERDQASTKRVAIRVAVPFDGTLSAPNETAPWLSREEQEMLLRALEDGHTCASALNIPTGIEQTTVDLLRLAIALLRERLR